MFMFVHFLHIISSFFKAMLLRFEVYHQRLLSGEWRRGDGKVRLRNNHNFFLRTCQDLFSHVCGNTNRCITPTHDLLQSLTQMILHLHQPDRNHSSVTTQTNMKTHQVPTYWLPMEHTNVTYPCNNVSIILGLDCQMCFPQQCFAGCPLLYPGISFLCSILKLISESKITSQKLRCLIMNTVR